MRTQIFTLKTERQGYYDITRTVREAVRESGIQSGIAVVFCPHTTGAITINENADPDVKHDLTLGLDAAFPDRAAFRHAEGNSDAHLKCSTVGARPFSSRTGSCCSVSGRASTSVSSTARARASIL